MYAPLERLTEKNSLDGSTPLVPACSLKLQRDKLRQYQKRIDAVLTREREIAKQALAAGNKQRALIALRQRKYQENLLEQTDKQLETLQKLVSSIEFSLVEKDVVFGLQQGSQVLKQLNAEMDLAKIEQLMSDTAEGVAYQQEVSAMLSSTMSAADEEDVLEQLAFLQAEQVNMPSVPTNTLPQKEATVPESEQQAVQPAAERRPVARERQMVPA
ncbi:Vacuolar protein sorting-associated protein 20 [Microbotryomycetes sp. JL201]|nr:Vacuolar protein sorting-associated protein 20 [Microbotryomycetes sp. JL201]